MPGRALSVCGGALCVGLLARAGLCAESAVVHRAMGASRGIDGTPEINQLEKG